MNALDLEILELERELGLNADKTPFSIEQFDQNVFSDSYPKCVNDQVQKGNTIFFGGINFKKLTQTEVAILFVRNFSGSDRWKEIREKKRKRNLEQAKNLQKQNEEIATDPNNKIIEEGVKGKREYLVNAKKKPMFMVRL